MRYNHRMKKVRSLVDSKLVERLNHVDNLTKIIFEAIGLPKAKHQIWAIKDYKNITILTNDSILATRMRLEQNQIINYIRNHSVLIVDSITIKMAMPEMERRQKHRSTYTLSEKSVKTIASIAMGIEDEELRESLLSIARNTRKRG